MLKVINSHRGGASWFWLVDTHGITVVPKGARQSGNMKREIRQRQPKTKHFSSRHPLLCHASLFLPSVAGRGTAAALAQLVFLQPPFRPDRRWGGRPFQLSTPNQQLSQVPAYSTPCHQVYPWEGSMFSAQVASSNFQMLSIFHK